jgi:hypothetical protein
MLGTEYSRSMYVCVVTCPVDIFVLPSICFITCLCFLLCVLSTTNSEVYKQEKFVVIHAARDFRYIESNSVPFTSMYSDFFGIVNPSYSLALFSSYRCVSLTMPRPSEPPCSNAQIDSSLFSREFPFGLRGFANSRGCP